MITAAIHQDRRRNPVGSHFGRINSLTLMFRGARTTLTYNDRSLWRIVGMRRGANGRSTIDRITVQVRDHANDTAYTEITTTPRDFWWRNAEICREYCANNDIPRSAYCGLYEDRVHRMMSNINQEAELAHDLEMARQDDDPTDYDRNNRQRRRYYYEDGSDYSSDISDNERHARENDFGSYGDEEESSSDDEE